MQPQQHIDQASHNLAFHRCIEENFSNRFFDWKITVLFYSAIHCLKAMAAKRSINIGATHADIELSVNPDRNNAKMRITRNAWGWYKDLYHYSRTARYEGITDFDTFEKLKEIDHNHCLHLHEKFKKYVQSQGVSIT